MSVVEKQVIFIMFAMGILGGLGYYIWYRRKRLVCGHTEPLSKPDSVEASQARVEQMADKNREYNDTRARDKDEDNLSAKLAEFSLQKTSDDNPSKSPVRQRARRQLGIYLPPPARIASSEAKTSKQQQSHENAHSNVSSSSLPTTPLEKASQSHTPISPADMKYIVTVQVPLWLVSRFIGRQGCSVKSLTQLSGAEFKVQRHTFTERSHTSCNITGSVKQIEAALGLISQRFPEVTLPNHPNMRVFQSRHKPAAKPCAQHSINNGITPGVIPFTQFLASVSYMDSLASIWVHCVNTSEVCPWQVLYEKMNTAYSFASGCSSEEDDEGVTVTKGQFYAIRTDRGDFVRGLVKEVSTDCSDTEYSVFLVDYGNHVTVTADRLIPLR